MRTVRQLLAVPLILLMFAVTPAFADLARQSAASATADQQHLVAPADIAAAVAGRVAHQDARRATIHEALARPEVKQMAESMGVDLTRANAAVNALAGVELEQAANAASAVNQQLVGGASTVVISTTTIIIILLLVIILIIAVK